MRNPLHSVRTAAFFTALLILSAACTDGQDRPPELGPHDGAELPPVEPERVGVGDVAPDFSLRAHDGDIVTLSDYRGSRDVLLVFYRGHW